MVSYFRYILTCLLAGMFATSAMGQIEHISTLKNRAIEQLAVFPQEKIYVQTDKPYYIGGEDIWFRIHIVNAFLHQPSTNSHYVYGELISPVDTLISRVKIRPDSLGYFHGNFQLKEGLAEGDYQLRFYTRYMENIGEDYFFRKKIRIGDPLSAIYSTDATFTRNERNQQLEVNLKFSDNSTGQLIWPEKIKVNYNLQNLETKPDKDSIVRFTMKKHEDCKYLHIEFDHEKKIHKQYIPIVSEVSDFDVTFHPEGGQLVMGLPCRIAFKALNNNGYGEEITGIMVNEAGDTISQFSSQHKGMGYFIICSNGEKYYAKCKNSDGVEKRFELPVPKSNSFALQTFWNNNNLCIKGMKEDGFQPDSVFLLVNNRGAVEHIMIWDFTKEYVQVSQDDLPSGVIQLILTDKNLTSYSERLIFNYNELDIASSYFSTNRDIYKNRELVKAHIQLADYDDNPLNGNFSLSVTDDNAVIPDTMLNICNYLLLSSDIRGYIEDPAYYFQEGHEANLDILMMTQGWRRYDFLKVLKGESEKPSIAEEKSFRITGSVKSGPLMNKANPDYPVDIIATNKVFFDNTVTDKNGLFTFENFEFPDSTRFIIQGLGKNGGKNIKLHVDNEIFPAITSLQVERQESKHKVFEQYVEKAEQHFIAENGMRMIYLKEIEVSAKKIERPKSQWVTDMNSVIKSDEFMKHNPVDIFQAISMSNIAGVEVSGETITIRGGTISSRIIDGIREAYYPSPLFVMDDVIILPEDASKIVPLINIHHIDEIAILKGPDAAIFGSRGSSGAIILTTKKGESVLQDQKQFNIQALTPLGYQVTKEFYSPKYETEEQKNSSRPDLRTTIHWAPCVVTNENGEAEVSFYSADSNTTYSVVYEGITNNGLPVHGRGKIKVEHQ